MSLFLSQLLTAPTVDNWRSMLLSALQGLGIVVESGLGGGSSPLGTGSITLSGTPTGPIPKIVVTITSAGELGSAIFKYSLDGGSTFVTGVAIPVTPGSVIIGSTGITLTFVSGAVGSGISFAVGDSFSFAINTPSLPVTSWSVSGGYRQLIEIVSQALAKISAQVAGLAAGGYTSQATSTWCDLIGNYFYQLPRLGVGNLAGITKGLVTISDPAGAGPFTITTSQMGYATASGLIYFNSNGGTLPKNGTLQLLVSAQSPGTQYNVSNNTIQSIVSGVLPGVTVNNPDPGTGSWITSQGTDPESDSAYMLRCMQRWPSLGTGSPTSAYKLWVTLAEAAAGHPTTIIKSLVQPDPAIAGQINIVVAGASGAVSGSAVTDVINYITSKVSLPATVSIQSATNDVITVAGVVNYFASKNSLSAVQAAVASALQTYWLGLDIGNGVSTVFWSEVQAAIGSVLGGAGVAIRNVLGLTTNGGTVDILIPLNQVATLTNSLTFAGV